MAIPTQVHSEGGSRKAWCHGFSAAMKPGAKSRSQLGSLGKLTLMEIKYRLDWGSHLEKERDGEHEASRDKACGGVIRSGDGPAELSLEVGPFYPHTG